jgi:hypothetical protein
MKSILNPSFGHTSSMELEIRKTFDRVWREVSLSDNDEAVPDSDCNFVWLECNGDVVDCASVKVVRVRRCDTDLETVEFICPQCKELHESLRFR